MKQTLIAATAAAALAVGVVAATSAHGDSRAQAGTTLHLSIPERTTHFKFVDVAPKGGMNKPPSLGDQIVLDAPFTRAGKAAGRAGLSCVTTQSGRAGHAQCVATFALKGGLITATGLEYASEKNPVYALTGGSGTYAGARGTVTVATGRTTKVTIKLK